MGIIRRGVYDKAAVYLSKIAGTSHFVETGTYYGATTEWASNNFSKVSTIELSQELYLLTSRRLSDKNNITFYCGDSRSILREIIKTSKEKCIFWLDAHWSGGETAGKEAQCPLITELNTIFSSSYDNIVMIDDARTYLLPPKKPNDAKQFPTIIDIIHTFDPEKVHLVVLDDVIYLIPVKYKEIVTDFFQEEARRSESEYYQLINTERPASEQKEHSFFGSMRKKIKRVVKRVCFCQK
jgi:hypothetical protein